MTYAEVIKWLKNLKRDISNPAHQSLWHYEQALAEIIEVLDENDESNNCLYYPCAVWDEMAFTRERSI